MKIAIAGVSYTGKSSLASRLAQEFKVPLVSTSSKKLLRKIRDKEGERFPEYYYDMSVAQLVRYQAELIVERVEKESSYTDFVGDGSLLEVLAYWFRFASREISTKSFMYYTQLIHQSIKLYDAVYYLPIGVVERTDEHPAFMKSIDFMLHGIISDYVGQGLRAYMMQEKTLEDRIKAVSDQIIQDKVYDQRVPATSVN